MPGKENSHFLILYRYQKNPEDGSPVKRPRRTAKHFESGKSPSKREFSPVVRGRSKIPRLVSGQEQPASKPEHSRVRQERSKNNCLLGQEAGIEA
ncbi:hypothetical protein TNIN_9341 [Trichonephila inaurata madagascariensis]|uniref:Uncharacterized protein n=1 Tax=Trichonephila inaurata madagascariensis TaxID=2747483 RepID=A0A8X6YWH5_9ARAC|nr:hypothetical protein TNIN_9341 [Trichonephila inaurata madagascariensis]